MERRFPGLDRPALSIPALDIAPGEHVALTGPSGSGKTTLINLLTALERPSAGCVLWNEVDIGRLSEGARDRWRGQHVGLVMQEFHLVPGLSTLDNVLLPRKLAQWRLPVAIKDEADRLLERVGLDRPDQPIETLSRGQMQRVALARALLGGPAIIVADEPTASLDATAAETVGVLLRELASSIGATLIVATHDPRLLVRFPRVLRLDTGCLTTGGKTAC